MATATNCPAPTPRQDKHLGKKAHALLGTRQMLVHWLINCRVNWNARYGQMFSCFTSSAESSIGFATSCSNFKTKLINYDLYRKNYFGGDINRETMRFFKHCTIHLTEGKQYWPDIMHDPLKAWGNIIGFVKYRCFFIILYDSCSRAPPIYFQKLGACHKIYQLPPGPQWCTRG